MYNPPKFRFKLAIWIAHHHCLYAIVQDLEFLELLQMLNSKVEIPHPTTIFCDIREIFALSRVYIGKVLQVRLVRSANSFHVSNLFSRHIQATCTYVSIDGRHLT